MSSDRVPRVLVLDDESVIRLNLCAYLEDEGFTVFSAASSEAALELLKEASVDISVVDIRLPGMDGNSFVMQAKRLYPHMKFLIHTGSSNYQVPSELAVLGMDNDDVFMKPIADMAEVAQAIRRKLEL
jgi:two-component system, OmpR family, response regulator